MTQMKPHFTNWISFGSLLTMVMMLVGGLGVFYTLQGQTMTNTRDLAEIKQDLRRTQEEVQHMKTQQVLYDERITSILGLLEKIDKRLERIEVKR